MAEGLGADKPCCSDVGEAIGSPIDTAGFQLLSVGIVCGLLPISERSMQLNETSLPLKRRDERAAQTPVSSDILSDDQQAIVKPFVTARHCARCKWLVLRG